MNTLRLLAATVMTLTVGCVTEVDTPVDLVPGTTVRAVQRPDSSIADGTHLVIDHAALRVTAQLHGAILVQEADATGRCDDDSAELVAFRSIRVEPSSLEHRFQPGEHVRVEGDLQTIDGHRRLVHATVTSIAMAAPYQAFCARDATLFADPAFDGVLVRTAGRALGKPPRSGAGPWSLRSCFTLDPVRIEPPIDATAPLNGDWRWVTGVVQQQGEAVVIQPRTSADVVVGSSDVCL